ncbi:hypothetical protein PDJAM_G00244140 [Pangasius djambal]|uniref:Uncharacterized protein n=1 Tax=Pangasius djambal TaxID=1691987 RepID=A0ACC5YHC7_9TELE|nr:hypothetical protein [Pangasius djambal]
MESKEAPEDRSRTGHQPGQCTPMPSPPLGTLKLVAGNGTSVGTVMTLLCPVKHRAVSGGRISCVQETNTTEWTGGTPECKPLLYGEYGFRLAVLLSIVSVAIILLMSIYFITSCLLKRVTNDEMRQLERERKREASRLWHQLNPEEQRESFYNHNDRINHNNSNNNTCSSSSRQEKHPRCHQKNNPDPLTIHHSQPTLGQMPPPLLCA